MEIQKGQERYFCCSTTCRLYYKWQDVRDRLGKLDDPQWTFYACRHTCASRLAQTGATLGDIADWLGHSAKSPVTRRYVHFFPKRKIDLARNMDNYEKKISRC